MAAEGPRIKELASKLYDACHDQFEADHSFFQEDLLSLNVVPPNDLALLMQCAQSLVNDKLFRLHESTTSKRLVWKLVSRSDAEKLQKLSDDEALVYNVIHSTGRSGIWVRTIGQRTNLHKAVLDRSLKSLEGKNFIKTVHNVKHPSRKVYMVAGLPPSEDVSGGAWFTDGTFDSSFINSLSGFIEYTVARQSWYEVPAAKGSGTDDSDRGRKRIRTATGKADVNGVSPDSQYLPFPANYKNFPTADAICAAVNASGITPVSMAKDHILQLIQMLCYDKKLIALPNGYFKSLKNPAVVRATQTRKKVEDKDAPPFAELGKNGMTESPCGPCPSFRLCSPGSAISPETCEYFDPWMEKVLGF
ncbi:uncharacterized protein N7459_006206 [Penicillium hispanicum]|uniref:uncharacterized protein n=1 Tax=Penicillium hispanicum TaxID=1080232 RepID=UPI0025400AC0|nr:uncharacterized protein N7459_006206 [Penicillium hispanicum]KAJ5580221.1 hypothetical protein N7459_006206 [Penicillium hispanicum]